MFGDNCLCLNHAAIFRPDMPLSLEGKAVRLPLNNDHSPLLCPNFELIVPLLSVRFRACSKSDACGHVFLSLCITEFRMGP
jgi:hypothetical protein